jgi:branched-chain amino acid transport system substrate-binding protein
MAVGLCLLLTSACGSQLSTSQLAAGGPVVTANPGTAPGAGNGETPAAVGPGSPSRGPAPEGGNDAAMNPASSDGGSRAGGGTGGGGSGSGPKSTLVFGAIGNATGILGAATAASPPAVRAWARYTNAHGGLDGHPVRIVFGETGGDPSKTQTLVRKMVEQDHILGIFWEYGFGEMASALPYLESKGVPVVGTIGATAASDSSKIWFNPMLGSTSSLGWAVVLPIAALSDKKNLAILYCQEASSCTNTRALVNQILPYQGIHSVYQAQYSLAQPDFTSEILAARSSGADVIMVLGDVASLNRIQAAAAQQNYHPQFAGASIFNGDLTLQNAKNLEGLISFSKSMPYLAANDAVHVAYREAMKQYEPDGQVTDTASTAFVVGELLRKLAPEYADANTPAALLKALQGVHGEHLGGLLPGITFPASANRADVNACVIPVEIVHGTWVAPKGTTFRCKPGWKPGT